MKKIVSVTLAGAILMVSGCNSVVTAESASKELCEISKSGDFDALVSHASLKLQEKVKKMTKKQKTKSKKRIIENYKDSDCSKITLKEKSTNKFTFDVEGANNENVIFSIDKEKNTWILEH